MILGCPKKLAAVQKRAKLHREKEEKEVEEDREKRRKANRIKKSLLLTPVIYLAGKAIYSNLLGKRKR